MLTLGPVDDFEPPTANDHHRRVECKRLAQLKVRGTMGLDVHDITETTGMQPYYSEQYEAYISWDAGMELQGLGRLVLSPRNARCRLSGGLRSII
ncbi:MAG: hypothetical protein NVS4B2_29310 [Chloroflexota bacterium]